MKSAGSGRGGRVARRQLLTTVTISAGLLSAIPQLTVAQSSEIDEIFVRERRIEETLPLDLSRYGSRLEIITAEDIERQGFTDIGQSLQRLVPGLFVAPKNGPFDY